MPAPSLLVVICAYTLDRWDDLRAAIGSVCAQRRPAEEIVLVVDHGPDLLLRARDAIDDVRVVGNRDEQGLSKATVARRTGSAVALAGERGYLRSTVPRVVVRALRPGAGTHPSTVAALVIGVGAVLLGYAVGRAGAGELAHRLRRAVAPAGEGGPP